MNASLVSPAQGGARRWLLLIHQLPPKPDYVRVKVRRRLHRLGAVALKNSVYVLPETEASVEDFQWLANEIASDGGDATICSASLLSGVSDEELHDLFRAQRDADYQALAEAARTAGRSAGDLADELRRLHGKLDTIATIDFFSAPGRADAEMAIDALSAKVEPSQTSEREGGAPQTVPRGGVWVTREGVFIDRIASAWLIRRFIDPEAQFRFVPAKGYRRKPGELRFDMYQGEFTHVGDRCTFETLLMHFQLDDPALAAIGQIVHDIDIKDAKFARPETSGIAAVMRGIAAATSDDADRIARGSLMLDALYGELRRGS